MKAVSFSDRLVSGVGKGVGLLLTVGRRLLVHVCALVVTGVLSFAAYGEWALLNIGVNFSIYIGLICLFPRGDRQDPGWYIPVGAGAVQGIAAAAFGLPWPLAVFWAGLQTWVQRLLQSGGRLGWEWTAAPFLALCLVGFFRHAAAAGLSLTPLWTFPVLALAAYLGRTVWMRVKTDSIHRTMLDSALRRLQAVIAGRVLPADVQQQAELLLTQGTACRAAGATSGKDGAATVERIGCVVRDVEALAEELRSKDWAKGLLRSQKWSRLSGAGAAAEKVLRSLRELNAFLLESSGTPAGTGANGVADDGTSVHEASARELLNKRKALPEALGCRVEGIVFAALAIVQNMRSDPRDRGPGAKFLNRYLKAVHRIVDEFIRLSGENTRHKDVEAALARSGELLERLEQAFKDEQAGMLQNDALNYTAELNALDTLLKMRGH